MSASLLAGRKLGRFMVERELGAGGMGMVVLARQESLDRAAVLKRIHPMLESSPELEARFEREAVTAARLHHPNVVGVYDRFHHRGHQYIATEYVDGLDLSLVLQVEPKLPWRIAATIALECARGLEAIHDEGTLHRDVKPQNLLIGRHGEVKITDFGLALESDRQRPHPAGHRDRYAPLYASRAAARRARGRPRRSLCPGLCAFRNVGGHDSVQGTH